MDLMRWSTGKWELTWLIRFIKLQLLSYLQQQHLHISIQSLFQFHSKVSHILLSEVIKLFSRDLLRLLV